MSGLDKWIHCSHAQAWVPEHTVGSLLSHTVTPAPGSHGVLLPWDCRPREDRLGKLGGDLQGSRGHEGLFRVLVR